MQKLSSEAMTSPLGWGLPESPRGRLYCFLYGVVFWKSSTDVYRCVSNVMPTYCTHLLMIFRKLLHIKSSIVALWSSLGDLIPAGKSSLRCWAFAWLGNCANGMRLALRSFKRQKRNLSNVEWWTLRDDLGYLDWYIFLFLCEGCNYLKDGK